MDQRCGPRVDIEIPVVLRLPEGRCSRATLTNLCCDGAFLRMPGGASPPVQSHVELELRLPYLRPRARRWRACVVHSRSDGLGLRFEGQQLGDLLPLIASRLGTRESMKAMSAG